MFDVQKLENSTPTRLIAGHSLEAGPRWAFQGGYDRPLTAEEAQHAVDTAVHLGFVAATSSEEVDHG